MWDNNALQIIIVARKTTCKVQASCISMSLYILEQPSSWRNSRIHPSCPWSRVRLNLLLDLFPQVYSCLLWPTQYLAVCSNSSHFTLDPFFACCLPNTCPQVNNTLALHQIRMDTQIYVTSALFCSFFTLLPLPLAGRLPLTLLVRHRKVSSHHFRPLLPQVPCWQRMSLCPQRPPCQAKTHQGSSTLHGFWSHTQFPPWFSPYCWWRHGDTPSFQDVMEPLNVLSFAFDLGI